MALLLSFPDTVSNDADVRGAAGARSAAGVSRAAEVSAAGVISALSSINDELSALPCDVASISRLSDGDLVAASTLVGHGRDVLGAASAVLAGEIARRSAPEFGSRGLAQRSGFRTPIEMVKVVTRTTSREAVAAVHTGTLIVETATEGAVNTVTGEVAEIREPWLTPLVHALGAGELSLAAFDAIRSGLGLPGSVVTVELLTDAVYELVDSAAWMDPDGLRRLARSARDEIDAAGIGRREQERRGKRSLRLTVLPDGMGRLVWTMDPETLATVKDAFDRATSPARRDVRFVPGDDRGSGDVVRGDDVVREDDVEHGEQRVPGDMRTAEQLASDAFAHLLAAGCDADPAVLMGSGAPVVKVIVTLEQLEQPEQLEQREQREQPERGRSRRESTGAHGFIEGQPDPISITTIERALEVGTLDVVVFDRQGELVEAGHASNGLNADGSIALGSDILGEGREHRLFSKKQKSDLAVRDGGCRWPGCGRPPSWCEAHHVEYWVRHRGPTLDANGILLCKHHHLLLHNNEWAIERRRVESPGLSSGSETLGHDNTPRGATEFWLIPPIDVDPEQTPRRMASTSAAWNEVFGPRRTSHER